MSTDGDDAVLFWSFDPRMVGPIPGGQMTVRAGTSLPSTKRSRSPAA